MNNIEEIKKKRFQFLHKLWDLSGEDESIWFDMLGIGEELGFDPELTITIVQYLRGEGLINAKGLDKPFGRITHQGIVEVEGDMISSQIQQSSHGAEKEEISMEEHPKAFICHASEDKERFVIDFAKKLLEKGVDAWVDRWEMKLGDSLPRKIFEEGIKECDVFIVVLSKYSVEKTWVKEELDAATVKRIKEDARLIPVIIDKDIEIPTSVSHLLRKTVKDLNNYEEEFGQILATIYEINEKPPLGKKPMLSGDTLTTSREVVSGEARNFLNERVNKIKAGETPIPMTEGAKICLHVIPLVSFDPRTKVDISAIGESVVYLPPLGSWGYNHSYTIDGFLTFSGPPKEAIADTYTLLFRNGIIETADASICDIYPKNNKPYIRASLLEIAVMEALPRYMQMLKQIKISPPIFTTLSLIGVKGFEIFPEKIWAISPHPIERDLVIFPHIVIENFEFDFRSALKPVFDALWNAGGYRRSPNYDEQGKWIKPW